MSLMDPQVNHPPRDEVLSPDTHLIIENGGQLTGELDQSEQIVFYTDDAAQREEGLPQGFNIVSNTDSGNIILTAGTDSQEGVELIQISPFGDVSGDSKVWQILPNSLNITTDSVVIVDDQAHTITNTAAAGDAPSSHTQFGLINTAQTKAPPADAPQWAKIINDCEKVGHYYRGWVPTEQDLDIVLTLHKQQTNSFWGTRQSPASNRPAARMMWKSQYVPFDGVPFINCGSRATVMECQFGPRRRGTKPDPKQEAAFIDFKHSCPARIYVKKVRKFPEFGIPVDVDKKVLKQMMDKSFQSLRENGFGGGGEERYYMQLPTVGAHEYHTVEPVTPKHPLITRTYNVSSVDRSRTRLAEPVATKIREIVASGIHHTTTIRKMLRKYVEKDLFNNEEPPVRHDLSYFPTVSDLKNHIHTALHDIQTGSLALREAGIDTLANEQDPDWTSNWISHISPHPETVTVTLTQDGDQSSHMISRVETHMSDGSTQVSSSLTPDTAALLARLHPNMFPHIQGAVSGEGDAANGSADSKHLDSDKLTQLVQSVLLQSSVKDLEQQQVPEGASHDVDDCSIVNNSGLEEPHEPAPPTEGVQLDLELHDTTEDVTEVILEGE